MKTCKDCIHYEACHRKDREIPANTCRTFKDNSLVLDLPCKVGTTVYVIFSQFKPYINECRIAEFLIRERAIFAVLDVHYPNYIARRKTSIPISWFNRFAFTTQEAAEQALKEREQG